jgi:hypothetical protein
MKETNEDRLAEMLRQAMPPIREGELQRDLWPRMLLRLEAPAITVSRLDWALIGLLALMLALFPEAIPGLMYLL